MDPVEYSAAVRAREKTLDAAAAWDLVFKSDHENEQRDSAEKEAQAFVQLTQCIAKAGPNGNLAAILEAHQNPILRKAAASIIGDDVFDGPLTPLLASSYVASISEFLILEQLLRYGVTLPPNLPQILVATGFSAGTVDEANPKAVRTLPLGLATATVHKAAALVVLSRELANATGTALFESELTKAIIRGLNEAALAALSSTSMTALATTGDFLQDLRLAVSRSEPSEAYVIAVSTAAGNDLALRLENRGATVRGGEFARSVQLVTCDSLQGILCIPASRVAIEDSGLTVKSSGEATVDLADTPSSPSEQTSLFQTNSVALLCERRFRLATDCELVSVGGA